MSQTGHPHPKADTGGQRPADPKKAGHPPEAGKGSVKDAVEASKSANGGKKDAKR